MTNSCPEITELLIETRNEDILIPADCYRVTWKIPETKVWYYYLEAIEESKGFPNPMNRYDLYTSGTGRVARDGTLLILSAALDGTDYSGKSIELFSNTNDCKIIRTIESNSTTAIRFDSAVDWPQNTYSYEIVEPSHTFVDYSKTIQIVNDNSYENISQKVGYFSVLVRYNWQGLLFRVRATNWAGTGSFITGVYNGTFPSVNIENTIRISTMNLGNDYVSISLDDEANPLFLRYDENGNLLEIIPITGGGVGEATGTEITVDQVSHGFFVGDVIRMTNTSRVFAKAQADSIENADAIGVVSEVTGPDQFKLMTAGEFTEAVPSFAAGSTVFLSPTGAGEMTDTEPNTEGQVSKVLGFIVEPEVSMIIQIMRGVSVITSITSAIATNIDGYIPGALIDCTWRGIAHRNSTYTAASATMDTGPTGPCTLTLSASSTPKLTFTWGSLDTSAAVSGLPFSVNEGEALTMALSGSTGGEDLIYRITGATS